MTAFAASAMHDETRALIRSRIETLLTSGTVASQVSRRLGHKGATSPWAETGEAGDSAPAPCARPGDRNNHGRAGWRSNSSRRESL